MLPTPYFDQDGIILYHAKDWQVLPDLEPESVDALITDPPYASGGLSTVSRLTSPDTKYCQNGKTLGRPTFTGDNRDQRSWMAWCALWLSQSLEAMKAESYALSFIDWRQLPAMTDAFQSAGILWRGVAAWDKGRGSRAPHTGYFRHQCEYLVWGTKGKCPKRPGVGPFDGCLKFPVKQKDKHHMTGKPTELLLELVKLAPEGGTVFDPFAGSSTSGVACALSGRKWIGVELSEEYCEISAKRIEQALKGEILAAA